MDCSFDPTQFCDIAINKIAFPFLMRIFLPISDSVGAATLYAKIAIWGGGLFGFILFTVFLVFFIRNFKKIFREIIRKIRRDPF